MTDTQKQPFVDNTDPAVRRFEKAMWELAMSLHDLGVTKVHGPADCYLVFGDEAFEILRAELVKRDTVSDYFTRPRRKNPDPHLMRWMVAGIQFGDSRSLVDAANRAPFWPAPPRGTPLGIRFHGGCPHTDR